MQVRRGWQAGRVGGWVGGWVGCCFYGVFCGVFCGVCAALSWYADAASGCLLQRALDLALHRPASPLTH